MPKQPLEKIIDPGWAEALRLYKMILRHNFLAPKSKPTWPSARRDKFSALSHTHLTR